MGLRKMSCNKSQPDAGGPTCHENRVIGPDSFFLFRRYPRLARQAELADADRAQEDALPRRGVKDDGTQTRRLVAASRWRNAIRAVIG